MRNTFRCRLVVASLLAATAVIPLAGLSEASPLTPGAVQGAPRDHEHDHGCGNHVDTYVHGHRDDWNSFGNFNFLNNILNFSSFNG